MCRISGFVIKPKKLEGRGGRLSMAHLSTLSLLLLFSSSLVSLSESRGGEGVIGVAAEQREFDYFVLALQWSATACNNVQKCCATNGCCRSNATSDFTIHGLWANYNDGSWPSCCNNGAKFDEKEIAPLLEGLQKYWPSYSCSKVSTCHGVKGLFWAHEWEKHGTCSTSVFPDEYNYFLATLNLYLKYNITDILIKEGYVPSNSEKYPLGGIISAIQNAVRATPEIVCANGAVKELHLCFYKNFEPRDCGNTVTSEANGYTATSCPSYISLPEFLPRGLQSTTGFPWSSSREAI